MAQRFYLRAEHVMDPLLTEEIALDLQDILRLINILAKQKRDVRLGRKIIFLLQQSNPKSGEYLQSIGVKYDREK